MNNSPINFQSQSETDKLNELSNLEINQYKIISNLQNCNDCSNSMYNEIMRLSTLQNKCREKLYKVEIIEILVMFIIVREIEII